MADWFGRFGLAAYAGWAAASAVFRKEALVSYPAAATACDRSDDYGKWDYRQLRYELFWSLYENSAYDGIHRWAGRLKSEYGLYRHVRGVYNPAGRLGEFWATHLMGGSIDPAAGDGRSVPSALPIETTNERVRRPIARVLRDSNWQTNKTVLCRLGSVLGDAGLMVRDDQEKGRVLLEVVHPASLPWVSKDTRGNVRGYCLRERRPNPEYDPRRPAGDRNKEFSTYTEYCWRTESGVRFSTFRDDQPYDWRAGGRDEPEWDAPYPFVPLAMVQHIKVDPGESFGLSELSAGLVKIHETNDLASELHDQVRKTVQGAWFITGMRPPRDGASPLASARGATTDNRAPDRTDVPVLYGGLGATATPLVIPLPIQETTQEIQGQLRDLEADYPELYHMRVTVTGDASAQARREARKPAEAKVMERRAAYDDPLARALGMAAAIGGFRRYAEFDGFDFDSYGRGDLDFRIGARPVFAVDVFDTLDRTRLFWTNASIAKGAGLPLRLFLKGEGYSAEQLAEYDAELERQVDQGIDAQARLAEATAEAAAGAQAEAQPSANGSAA